MQQMPKPVKLILFSYDYYDDYQHLLLLVHPEYHALEGVIEWIIKVQRRSRIFCQKKHPDSANYPCSGLQG